MKFHHNPHVQELLRLGNEVLAGREMQRSRRKISDQISGWLWLIGGSVLLPVIIMHWGTEPDGLKAFPAWRWLVMGLVGDLAARFLHSTLMNGTLQSTEAGVLLHLPISGEILVREAVRTVLLRALVWLPFVAGGSSLGSAGSSAVFHLAGVAGIYPADGADHSDHRSAVHVADFPVAEKAERHVFHFHRAGVAGIELANDPHRHDLGTRSERGKSDGAASLAFPDNVAVET